MGEKGKKDKGAKEVKKKPLLTPQEKRKLKNEKKKDKERASGASLDDCSRRPVRWPPELDNRSC